MIFSVSIFYHISTAVKCCMCYSVFDEELLTYSYWFT